jgi:AraC-like DNA-binding protein
VAWARAATLTNYAELARSKGLDPEKMLARVKIDPEDLRDPDTRISSRAVLLLLEDSAIESGCTQFGLLLAELRPFSLLGALSLLLEHQETLRDTLVALIEYQHVLSDTLSLSLEDLGDSSILRTQLITQIQIPPRQGLEFAMAVTARALLALGGGEWRPESAHFMHRAPADLGIHRRVFRCDLQFESSFNGFVYSAAALTRVNRAAEVTMAHHARAYLDGLHPGRDSEPIAERTRRALYLLLPLGRGGIDQVAAHFGMGERTLQRLLGREGQKFSGVLNHVRRELVVRHLNNPAHSLSAIAELMGYATLSSFTRWFTAEFGVSPSAWRAAAAKEPRAAHPGRELPDVP